MTDLFDRQVADKVADEAAWLEARRQGVTATEVAKLAKGSAGYALGLVAEKLSGQRSFFGNQYTDWGLEREEFLVATVLKAEGFIGTDVLFHAEGNKRHLATPDGLYLRDGMKFTAEIKTGKHDLAPGSKFFEGSGYRDQILWQMYVAGDDVDAALYVWERHDDQWVHVAEDMNVRPMPFPAEQAWIERDQKRIDELIFIADAFLTQLDADPEQVPPDADDYRYLAEEYLGIDEKIKRLSEAKETVAQQIRGLIGLVEQFAVETGTAKVTLSTGTRTTFDSAKFKAAEPTMFTEYTKVSAPTSTLRVTSTKEKS
jgi:hypothetical protein